MVGYAHYDDGQDRWVVDVTLPLVDSMGDKLETGDSLKQGPVQFYVDVKKGVAVVGTSSLTDYMRSVGT